MPNSFSSQFEAGLADGACCLRPETSPTHGLVEGPALRIVGSALRAEGLRRSGIGFNIEVVGLRLAGFWL